MVLCFQNDEHNYFYFKRSKREKIEKFQSNSLTERIKKLESILKDLTNCFDTKITRNTESSFCFFLPFASPIMLTSFIDFVFMASGSLTRLDSQDLRSQT